MIQYIADDIKLPKLEKMKLNKWIKAIAAQYEKKIGEIAYVFCSDSRILEINNQYLQHDYYTDIITFDYTAGDSLAGDIFISVDTVKSNSEEYGVDFQTELDRILIHGILHLCGQDDKTDALRKEMTRKEDEALVILQNL